jgi:HAD superfamily hydrolase (TIGR01549 family)
MQKKQAAIFDLDGTLAPTMDVLKNYFMQRVQELLNRSVSREEFAQFYHYDMFTFLEMLGLQNKSSAVALEQELRALEAKQSRSEFFNGTIELIADLHKANFDLYLWTLRYQQSSLQMLEHNQVLSFFSDFHCGDHEEPKPSHLGIKEKLLEDYQQMFMIGDTVTDVIAGKNLGATTIGVTWAKTNPKEMLKQAGADHILDNVSTLRSFLLS